MRTEQKRANREFYYSTLRTSDFKLWICGKDNRIVALGFTSQSVKKVKEAGYSICDNSAKLEIIIKEVKEYLDGNRKQFSIIPLFLKGTKFQIKVWKKLLEIPYGERVTYGKLAKMIGNKKAVRAVGQACGKNPIAIVVPCHRIVASNGCLGGYSAGLDIKKKLLLIEDVNSHKA